MKLPRSQRLAASTVSIPANLNSFGRRSLAADPQREDQVAAAVAVRAEDAVKPIAPCRGGSDVAMGQAAGDGEGILLGGNDGAAL